MASPDERADDRDRNAAAILVEEAMRAGRIVAADRDLRLEQLRQATTVQEVDLVVRDLRQTPVSTAPPTTTQPTATQPSATQPSATPPWPDVVYGPPSLPLPARAATGSSSGAARVVGGVITAVVLVVIAVTIIGVAIAFTASRDSIPDFGSVPVDDATYAPGQAPGEDGVNVHTVEGFADLVDALRTETGQVFVYDAVIYPRYAVLEVPTGTGDRYESWYWDGLDLRMQDSKGVASDDLLDLSLVEPRGMIDLLAEVRSRVDTPEYWYAIYRDPDGADATQLSVYASNDFGETAYVIERLDGTVVSQSQP